MTGQDTTDQSPAKGEPDSNAANDSSQQQAAAAAPPPAAAPAQEQPQQQRPAAAPRVHKTDYEKDVVYVYQFSRSGVSPSPSPYCLKLETWLRVNQIRYENVEHKIRLRSKKGQLPFIELNGEEIADSSIIIQQLAQRLDKDLDTGLTAEERAISRAFSAMVEHHTSWIYKWWRFQHPQEFLVGSKLNLASALGTRIPAPIVNFFAKLKIRNKRCAATAQGIGVHKADEIYEFAKEDLAAVNTYLGDKTYLFGEEITNVDVVLFSHLTQFLYGFGEEVKTPFPPRNFLLESCPKLVALVDRIKVKYWPDWDEITSTLDLNTHLPKKVPEEPAPPKDNGDKPVEEREKEGEDSEKKAERDEKETEVAEKIEEVKDTNKRDEEKSNNAANDK